MPSATAPRRYAINLQHALRTIDNVHVRRLRDLKSHLKPLNDEPQPDAESEAPIFQIF